MPGAEGGTDEAGRGAEGGGGAECAELTIYGVSCSDILSLLIRTLQALREALTRLDEGLEAVEALRREHLSRLTELVQPGSFIAIRRDPADDEFPAYQ